MNKKELLERQNWELNKKIEFSKNQISLFYEVLDGKVYVAFSGGKDSTVLLHLVRSMYPQIKAVFVDTGLEYPAIRDFVKTIPNVIWIKPKKSFLQVIKEYGYPVVSKEQAKYIREIRSSKPSYYLSKCLYGKKGRYKVSKKWKFLIYAPFKISERCCDILKKNPAKKFEKESNLRPILGTKIEDSKLRLNTYLKYGCNNFQKIGKEKSTPIAFWTDNDVWNYIKQYNVKVCDLYYKGIDRTGCIYCMFGLTQDKGKRFLVLKELYPNLYEYCMNKLGIKEVLRYMANYNLETKQIYEKLFLQEKQKTLI